MAPDGRHLLFADLEPDRKLRFTVVDGDTLTPLWNARWEGDVPQVYFSPDAMGIVFSDPRSQRYELVDTCSGKTRVHFSPFPRRPDGWPHVNLSEERMSGPFVLLCARQGDQGGGAAPASPGWIDRLLGWLPWRTAVGDGGTPDAAVAVIDTRDGRVVFKQADATFSSTFGFNGHHFALLAPDGSALLTAHREGDRQYVACYDIPARSHWAVVLGVPLGDEPAIVQRHSQGFLGSGNPGEYESSQHGSLPFNGVQAKSLRSQPVALTSSSAMGRPSIVALSR
jgi:hypothetical protein